MAFDRRVIWCFGMRTAYFCLWIFILGCTSVAAPHDQAKESLKRYQDAIAKADYKAAHRELSEELQQTWSQEDMKQSAEVSASIKQALLQDTQSVLEAKQEQVIELRSEQGSYRLQRFGKEWKIISGPGVKEDELSLKALLLKLADDLEKSSNQTFLLSLQEAKREALLPKIERLVRSLRMYPTLTIVDDEENDDIAVSNSFGDVIRLRKVGDALEILNIDFR